MLLHERVKIVKGDLYRYYPEFSFLCIPSRNNCMKIPVMNGKQHPLSLAATFALLFFLSGISGGQVIINELCPNNGNILADADGDFSDWIELLNTGSDTVDLAGYCLSDDADNYTKWCFPEYLLMPGEYLLVFASGKDLASPPEYWHTIVEPGDQWRYILPDQGVPGDWRSPEFNDSSWMTGQGGIGYGDGDDATVIPSTLSVFLRRRFQVEDHSGISAAVLHMDFDDGFVAYLNGIEIARAFMSGDLPGYNVLASGSHEAAIYSGGEPLKYELENPAGIFRQGENVLAIQVHNVSETSSDMSALPFLSIRTDHQPVKPPPAILNLSRTYYHTNFKLKADQDLLFLTRNQGTMVDSVSIPFLDMNISYGRKIPPTVEWVIFATPTPGEPNNTFYFEGNVDGVPEFSEPGGRFSGTLQLSLSAPRPDDNIYITFDGSVPGPESPIYDGPLEITSGAIVRARILKSGFVPGRVVTRTYFSSPDNGLPAVCLSTDPYNLWDQDYGIYTDGPNAEADFPHFNANYWQDWERPAHVEFYNAGAGTGFSLDAGIKINGAWSRGFAQKSIAIYARRKYGEGRITCRIFREKPISEFESIVLRNSGNDWVGHDVWGGTMFRDVLMTRLLGDLDVEHAASLQSTVYINGEYWGIMNIREKINEHFIASNNGVEPDRIDFLEGNQWVIAGSPEHYARLIDFLHANSMQREENYEWVKKQMDIQNYINYQLAEIYYDNGDWPGNNIKYWRSSSASGKWRWIVFDTDHGFGMWDPAKVYHNTLVFAMEENGPDWPNPPWSTYLFRTLLENLEFREQFINSFADRLNTRFRSDTVDALINRLSNNIAAEMISHMARWGQTIDQWNYQVSQLVYYADQRPAIMREHIRSTFELGDEQKLEISVSAESGGRVKLNSIILEDFPWEGIYFQGIPVDLTALPDPGHRFKYWSGDISLASPKIRIDPNATIKLVANFEAVEEGTLCPVLINEICYMQDTVAEAGDWIELFNNSDQYIDISGWILKDSDDGHAYVIRNGTILEPNGYYLVCRDRDSFEILYPDLESCGGGFDFGFSSSGDMVRLYTADTVLVDSVLYGIYYPWPYILPGSGYTLALKDPDRDNSIAVSWSLSDEYHGTPGQVNFINPGLSLPAVAYRQDILYQNSPNPFSDETRIVFYSGRNQPVRICVYDLNGRLIRTLADRQLEAGYHEFTWTPENQAEGILILRAETPETVYTRKMIRSR
jgi:hypothetical protein